MDWTRIRIQTIGRVGTNIVLAVAGLAVLLMCASEGARGQACALRGAKNGDFVTIRAVVFPTDHDILIRPEDCSADAVVLVYGDDESLGRNRLALRRDKAFRNFEKQSYAQRKPKTDSVCRLCLKYRVTADFEGRLDVTSSAGFKRDPKSKKVTGLEGFGHPIPFTRYRLVLAGVAHVESVERDAARAQTR